MSTDFFERQAVARRNTGWLAWLFLLAVTSIIAATYLAAWLGCVYVNDQNAAVNRPSSLDERMIPLYAALGAAGLILLGSLYKLAELRGGGTVVAERVGGRRLYPNTDDPTEKKLLNVVEEMALASGVPVPPVYLLEKEQGINAFAAGYSPSDAVIGVTRGCAEQLSRDELQGVIAHEFSHILNGDMRLNIRLIGVLHGILLLGLLGQMLFRVGAYSGSGRSRNGKGNGALYVILIGLVLAILGYLGTVFGNLIKAAVSRQREFLADSSAVQFTRNPGGIAGALKKIGGLVFGSKVKHPNAGEASHMYFASGLSAGLTSLLATHPPLGKRIRRVDPQWDGKFPRVEAGAVGDVATAGLAAGLVGDLPPSAPVEKLEGVENASGQVGHPTARHRFYAAELVASLPERVVDAAHDPYGARAVLYCLLLDRDEDIRAHQVDCLARLADEGVMELTAELSTFVDEIDVRARLPLVDMTLPALRAMSPTQYRTFVTCFQELVQADERLGLFEWSLHQILLRHLKPQFERLRTRPVMFYGLQRLGEPCSVLLSTLAHAGQAEQQAETAFRHAAKLLSQVRVTLLPRQQCELPRLQAALDELAQAAPKLRGQIVDACGACICADRKVTVREGELLRAISDMLDCPLPPLLPGQEVESTPPAQAQTAASAGMTN